MLLLLYLSTSRPHRLSRVAAHGAGVGLRALTARRKPFNVTRTAVAADLLETLDVRLGVAAKFTFYLIALLNFVAEQFFLSGGECGGAGIFVDLRFCQNVVRFAATDTIHIGKGDFDALIRKGDTCDTCHNKYEKLPLTLLMLRGLTNHMETAVAANHLAISTNRFHGGADFHDELEVE